MLILCQPLVHRDLFTLINIYIMCLLRRHIFILVYSKTSVCNLIDKLIIRSSILKLRCLHFARMFFMTHHQSTAGYRPLQFHVMMFHDHVKYISLSVWRRIMNTKDTDVRHEDNRIVPHTKYNIYVRLYSSQTLQYIKKQQMATILRKFIVQTCVIQI